MRERELMEWTRLLPEMQIMKNRRFHRGILRTPFEAMFGRKLEMGNQSGNEPTLEERGLDPLDLEEGDEENQVKILNI